MYYIGPSTTVIDIFQIDQILGEEPEVKEKLFAVLKQYAAEKKVDWLASVLPDILTTDEQQTLIGHIRYLPLILGSQWYHP